VAVVAVCAATLLVTAGHALLPSLMRDAVSAAGSLHQYVAACTALVSLVALIVLWIRRGSVLDLWLMVVLCDYLIEICLLMFPVAEPLHGRLVCRSDLRAHLVESRPVRAAVRDHDALRAAGRCGPGPASRA
jgi:hypothetical protein